MEDVIMSVSIIIGVILLLLALGIKGYFEIVLERLDILESKIVKIQEKLES